MTWAQQSILYNGQHNHQRNHQGPQGFFYSSIQGCCWNNGWLRSSSGGGDGSGHNSSSSLPCFLIYLSPFIAPIGTLHISYNVLAAKSKILNCCSSQMIPHAINPVCWKCGARKVRSPALLPWPIGSVANTAPLNIYSIESECYLFLWSYFDLKLWDFGFRLYMGLEDLAYQWSYTDLNFF